MAIIKPLPNQPLNIKLKYVSAKEKQGRGGIDFMYTLENGDALFVPPIAHQEIQSLHPGAGEPFTLLKSIGQGNQIVWKVERIQPGSSEVRTDCPAVPKGGTEGGTDYIASKHITSSNGVKPQVDRDDWSILKRALFSVIEDAKAAEDYASGKGLSIRFTGTDIRAMANTRVINLAGGR